MQEPEIGFTETNDGSVKESIFTQGEKEKPDLGRPEVHESGPEQFTFKSGKKDKRKGKKPKGALVSDASTPRKPSLERALGVEPIQEAQPASKEPDSTASAASIPHTEQPIEEMPTSDETSLEENYRPAAIEPNLANDVEYSERESQRTDALGDATRSLETVQALKADTIDPATIALPTDEVKEHSIQPDVPAEADISGVPKEVSTRKLDEGSTFEEKDSGRPSDIDFAASVAAGLQGSGFDPDIAINDPTFHRSPSRSRALEEPDYNELPLQASRRSSRRSSRRQSRSASIDPTSRGRTAETTEGKPPPSNDNEFAAVLAAGLQGSGFDPDIVRDDVAYSQRRPEPFRAADDDEPEGFSEYHRRTKRVRPVRQDQSQSPPGRSLVTITKGLGMCNPSKLIP